MKIVELTSAHPQLDTRIFQKISKTFVSLGYEVVHIGPRIFPGVEGLYEGVIFKPIPLHASRFERFTKNLWRIYKAALNENADLYHFHDPDLILVGLLLKCKGKRVIYDIHEDYVDQMLYKSWIPSFLRKPIGFMTRFIEKISTHFFDGIIAATPTIAQKYSLSKTLTLCNYPLLESFTPLFSEERSPQPQWVIYIGSLSEVRGFYTMLEATAPIKDIKFKLAGPLPKNLSEHLLKYPQVDYLGNLPKEEVINLLSQSAVGLVVLHPTHTYIYSLPVKMFEYMAAGIPVVASDFPLFKDIIETHGCGICVNPLDTKAIQKAIEYLLHNPEEAKLMGQKGQQAVLDKYNWEAQIPLFKSFTQKIIQNNS
jgi:glycosyltransferase involved in cell wall biosynthesis